MKKKFNFTYVVTSLIASAFLMSSCSASEASSNQSNSLIKNNDFNIYSSSYNNGPFYRFINDELSSYIKDIKNVYTLQSKIGLSYNSGSLNVYNLKSLMKDVDFKSTSWTDGNKKLLNENINVDLINDKDYSLTAYCNEITRKDINRKVGTYARVNVVPSVNNEDSENKKPWYVFIFTSCNLSYGYELKNDRPSFY